MAARAMWKGTISFGTIECPVKLYSAVEDRDVHFRLLHESDRAPVKQKLVEARGQELDPGTLQRGAAVTKNRFVVLTPQQIESVEPEPSRTISIEGFVPSASIDIALYDRPYWLAPDGSGALYAAIVDALRRQKREGIARWVMRGRAYVGALGASGNHLSLIRLRHAGEVVLPSEMHVPSGREANAKERTMARQLLSMLEGAFDPGEYRDDYRERVLELVRKKAAGKKIELHAAEKKRPARDLHDALEKSLAAVAGGARAKKQAKERTHG